MNIISVIKIINRLKQRRKIKNYAIFGAVGASFYMPAIHTRDIDIIVTAPTDIEYSKIWRELRKYADRVLDFGFVIDGTPVQILPTSIGPLFEDALQKANKITTGGIVIRVVDKEHLILLFLKANRQKDRQKASILLQQADMSYLGYLLEMYDKDEEIKKKIQSLY